MDYSPAVCVAVSIVFVLKITLTIKMDVFFSLSLSGTFSSVTLKYYISTESKELKVCVTLTVQL